MKRTLDFVRQLDDAVRHGLPRHELDSLFDTLVQAYSSISEDHRKQVRDAYNKCSHWGTFDFWMENPSHILRFRKDGEIEDLRRALAHYSLSDGYPDARDAIVGMSDLLVDAERHGVDPRPVFSEIAAISNPDGTWGLQSHMQARSGSPTGETSEEELSASHGLVVYEPPDHEPRVVSEQPDLARIRETIQGLACNDITFVVLSRDEDNWIEFSGSNADGFSARHMENGQEHVISQAPNSIADGVTLLDLYLREDERWRTEYEWE